MKEIIDYLLLKDRFQWSQATEDAADHLHKTISKVIVHGSSRVIKLQKGDISEAYGFMPPQPWGIRSAEASFHSDSNLIFLLKSSSAPLMVATNSKACQGRFRIQRNLGPAAEPSFVMHNSPQTLTEIIAYSSRTPNIHGVLTKCSSKRINNIDCRGRLELHNSQTTVLNLTHSEHLKLTSTNLDKCTLHVDIKTETDSKFSILEYIFNDLSKNTKTEIWLCAHLCHPRPGANDNASGIAAMLEIIKRLETLPKSSLENIPTVKIIISPEFTGMAQYLKKAKRLPSLVINIDTIGGNQIAAGKNLTLELPPSFIRSQLLDRFVEHIKSAIHATPEFDLSISYFKGYSDHALFAANCFEVPAVMLAQENDIFNHTDQDTVDKLDFSRIKRVADAVFSFITSANLSKSEERRRLVPRQPHAYELPFNYFKLLEMTDRNDLDFIKSSFQKNKATFALLQYAWILKGKNFSQEEIKKRIPKIENSEQEQVATRLISIIDKTMPGRQRNAI
ncbi:DUF4910 domain-containing protein [Pseudomonas corrugata]|uniref:DUF4910 domain-containing protein n=1 Tax=Pseudomonas corrugata TaxID=47879 RepID=UPI0028C4DE4F|nr:DUF4910 domain-containing protein [Pseudomonas corrugata]MDU9037059.1 DUF4910 domain-containing protein [Pseudomonas corrugata]